MTDTELILWNKIHHFQLDDPQASFTFSTRLARENGWTKEYSLRVIEEYKKFIFLCCITETGITPSDPVDQAWHLHLTYTRSYWIDLCKNTLEKEIHHNPTKGGQSEADKFDNFYTHSRDVYISKFDEEPPEDIWHSNKIRFSDINFQRINLKKYWLIKKPGKIFKYQLIVPVIILTGLASIYTAAGPIVLLSLLGVFFIVGTVINRKRKKDRKNRNGGSGCAGILGCSIGSGCSNSGHSGGHHGSGCGSGCSGCSGSGCSGCGGGGCGGGGD